VRRRKDHHHPSMNVVTITIIVASHATMNAAICQRGKSRHDWAAWRCCLTRACESVGRYQMPRVPLARLPLGHFRG
jgi:hypothetical protein